MFINFLTNFDQTGVTVYTPTAILNQSSVVIMFQSGAGVEVVENHRYLSCRVYLPITYMVNSTFFPTFNCQYSLWLLRTERGVCSVTGRQTSQTISLYRAAVQDPTWTSTIWKIFTDTLEWNVSNYFKKHKVKTQLMSVVLGAVDDKVDPFKGKSLFTHENTRSSNFFFDASFQPIYEVRPLLPLN